MQPARHREPLPVLQIRELRRSFGDPGRGTVHAVDAITFSVARGEVVGLLGPNGAGKTTTLRMVATLLTPTAGDILIAGHDAVRNPLAARRQMSYLPAEAGLPPRLTPREVVTFMAQIQGVADPSARAEQCLARLGALGFAGTPCGDLSTGMRRRVGLAQALVHAPALLLLDEPTDGLDVPGRHAVLRLVAELAEEGCAVLLSSHIMSEVAAVAGRFVVLAQGRVVADGSGPHLCETTNTHTLDAAFLRLVGQE